ncbi:MAG: alpha-L-fucosidase [Verrucomicrobia bacterium]|nr:alpha-L-fucosidase [Verrucomicrobiota bacterium]
MHAICHTAASLALGLIAGTGILRAEPAKPFTPEWESLKQYRCPDWFRDAKFGIWAHWGPQSVPMFGDWYARHLYTPDHRDYQHHLENYGHPSEHGFKDIIPLWKAEKWDPERLMGLYKEAGARYFVSMGVHHDNFDLWNSKYHKWNAVNMGPKRDVVGDWQKAAKKYGLRFGVSEHLGASYTWWAASKGADKTGPKAGVPYDGANPEFADLYHPLPEPGDKGWYSTNPVWHAEWSKRIHNLIETYQPDLLYSDGGLPFGLTGRKLLADYYNSNMAAHGGNLEAVYNCKSHHGNTENNQFVSESCVHDMERGVLDGIQPLPWQTDTSIGDWFYNKNWKYQPSGWTIHMLVDIVSKNGNLLLNVVQRPDGSLDPEVEITLADLATWNKIHGEAIFGTRPWEIYGEGPVRAKGGPFKEKFDYTAKDIRFTTKGGALYAIALGWPEDGKLVIRSLDKAAAVKSVALLGSAAVPQWKKTDEGLEISLPAEKISPHTVAVRIEGENLHAAKP